MAAEHKIINKVKKTLPAVGLLGLLGGPVYAADVGLIGTVDVTSSGKVSTAKMLQQGKLKTGLFIDSSAYAVPLKNNAPGDSELKFSNDKLLESSNKTSLFVGYGVFDWLELNLGVRATTDSISDSNRQEFFQRWDFGAYYDRDTSGAESGMSYAGSIINVKGMVYDAGNLKMGVSAFFEEGVGGAGEYSASKSADFKLGYQGLVSYGYKDLGQVNLNVGYRSRKAEEIGDKHIGNEIFYKTSLMYHITKRWGAYTSLEGRGVKVAETENPDSKGYLKYEHKHEMASQIGVTGYVYKNYKMDVYLGGGLDTKNSIGTSERYFGLSLSVPFNILGKSSGATSFVDSDKKAKKKSSAKKRKVVKKPKKKKPSTKQPTTSSDDEIYGLDGKSPSKKDLLEKSMKEDAKKQAKKDKAAAKKNNVAYPEMNDNKKLYDVTGTDNDFAEAKKRAQKESKKKTVDLDQEVEKYKKLDERMNQASVNSQSNAQAKKAQYEAYMRQKRAAEQEIADRLQKELGADYEITDEDANWTGLEN